MCYTKNMAELDAKKIDLHSHTTASDGGLSPTELVRKAFEVGIGTLAVTDHDTVTGYEEARRAGESLGVRIVPGVEFGTNVDGAEVHLLGYLFDPGHAGLLEGLARLREGRLHRGKRMVEKLRALGIPVSWERVDDIARGGSVGRPHVAQALIELGHAVTIDEAFEKYLSRGRPAYVERTQITPEECLSLVHDAGGVVSLAHPAGLLRERDDILPHLVEAGLDGLETYYGSYTPGTVAWLERLAMQYGLATTGGSDYHGLESLSHSALGSVSVPPESLAELERQAGLRSRN